MIQAAIALIGTCFIILPVMSEKTERFLVPVLASSEELKIPWDTLHTIISGRSVIDIEDLYVTTGKEAYKFVKTYGFDLKDPEDRSAVESIFKLALDYVSGVLLPYGDIKDIPERYRKASVSDLLLEASQSGTGELPNWPCALLKILHCAVHACWTHDMEAHAAALEIIKARVFPYVYQMGNDLWIGDENCSIPLVDFNIKENKSFSRTMTKLLHKPGNLALNIFDRLGIRFVATDIFSAVLLIKFLRTRNIVMFANNIPEQSRNSLAEFAEIKEMFQKTTPALKEKWMSEKKEVKKPPKNPFSGRSFKMIKFIERVLVKTKSGRRVFFPYEVQILDGKTWEEIQKGESRHEAYERRQIRKVQERIFGRAPV